MLNPTIKPIHNFKADGNSIVDVVIYQGDLWVRLISYKEYENHEILISKNTDFNSLEYGKSINKNISLGLKYCEELGKILTLSDLTNESKRVLTGIKESEGININNLQKATTLSDKTIRNSIHHLLDKYIITRVGNEKYAYQDRYGHLREFYKH